MSARSLNKVQLIGNLTRDPELRYTPQGTAVCTFGVATNRSWTTDSGEKKESAEFHRIVAWNKLAEICSQLLSKGRKVFVEGRLSTRNWTAADGTQKTTTEVVIEDMILLDKKPSSQRYSQEEDKEPEEEVIEIEEQEGQEQEGQQSQEEKEQEDQEQGQKEQEKEGNEKQKDEENNEKEPDNEKKEEELSADDIPF